MLKALQNLAEVKEISSLSLEKYRLKDIEEKIIRLYTMGEVLLVESTEAKFDIRNLLVWLNKCKMHLIQPPSNHRAKTRSRSRTPRVISTSTPWTSIGCLISYRKRRSSNSAICLVSSRRPIKPIRLDCSNPTSDYWPHHLKRHKPRQRRKPSIVWQSYSTFRTPQASSKKKWKSSKPSEASRSRSSSSTQL